MARQTFYQQRKASTILNTQLSTLHTSLMPSFLPHQQHHYKDHHRCRDEHHGDDDEQVSVIAASTYGGFLLDLDQFPEWANATQCPEK